MSLVKYSMKNRGFGVIQREYQHCQLDGSPHLPDSPASGFPGTDIALFPYALGPLDPFLGGEPGHRIEEFPEALVGVDDHSVR